MSRKHKIIKLGFSECEYKTLRRIAKENKVTLKGLIYNRIFRNLVYKELLKI
jgi:hypothetical protein